MSPAGAASDPPAPPDGGASPKSPPATGAASPSGSGSRSGPGFGPDRPDNGFVLKRERDGVTIYIRDVPDTGGLLEFKGVIELPEATLSAAIALFDDTASYPEWMYETAEGRVLRRVDFFERYTYTVIKVPWPFRNRDVVAHARMRQIPETGEIDIRIEGVPDYIPRRAGHVRVPMMRARWSFTPRPGGGVTVAYRMYSAPGGNLSKRLANMVIEEVPYETLTRFRERVRAPKYARARYAEVKDPQIPSDPGK